MSARLASGTLIAGLLVLLAAAGLLLPAAAVQTVDAARMLEPPSWAHVFGTDDLGRDVLARVAAGAGPSLGTGLVAMLLAVALGTVLGALAAVGGPVIDTLLSRGADIVNAFPPLLGALAIVGLAPPAASSTAAVLRVGLIIGAFAWPSLFRFARAEVRRIAGSEFALAARAAGAGPFRIAIRHLLPLALGTVVVPASFLVAGAILVEAALGFLGVGLPVETPTWGNVLQVGFHHRETAWWLIVFPGAAVFLTVLACQLIGEGLAEDVSGRAGTP